MVQRTFNLNCHRIQYKGNNCKKKKISLSFWPVRHIVVACHILLNNKDALKVAVDRTLKREKQGRRGLGCCLRSKAPTKL